MNYNLIKKNLLEQCYKAVEQRIGTSQKAMEAAQESANEETKSSAGDKYETGRAMAQQERDKYARQLSEAVKLKKVLDIININKTSDKVALGSLVVTSGGTFFVSVSVGRINFEGKEYFAIAPASPIAQALLDKEKGQEVTFNGKKLKIDLVK